MANDLKNEVVAEVSALSHHHVSLGFIGVILLAFALLGGLFYHNMVSYEKQMAVAQAHEETYQASLKTLNEQLVANAAAIAKLTEQQKQVQTKIVYRDKTADEKIKGVTNPENTVAQVAQDSENYLGALPTITPDGLLAYQPLQVQGFVATKIDRDRLEGNLADVHTILDLEKDKVTRLDSDLAANKETLRLANITIDDYKKAAKKGKWRRMFEGAGKFSGGVIVGAAVAKFVF
jgi:hypothetical protein